MTLQEITQRICGAQQMAGKDPSAALAKNRALFVDLARQNEIFIVPDAAVSDDALIQKQFRPYIAPAQANDPRLFLRIFSHEDAAAAFAEKNQHHLVAKIDGVELMQLAKFYFLRGIYGFLLNDGLAWAALSFPDFLMDCFKEILGDPTLSRPEYVSLVQLINMVRQNDFYRISVARQVVKSANEPEKLFFMDQKKKERFSAAEYVFEELSLPKLLQFTSAQEDAHIHIRTEKINCTVSSDMLRAAFYATGLNQMETGAFKTELNFHTDSIALDFRIQDFTSKDGVIPCHVQLAELPRPHDKAPEPPKAANPLQKVQAWIGAAFERLKQHRPTAKSTSKEDAVCPEESPTPAKRKLSPVFVFRGILLVVFFVIVGTIAVNLMKPTPLQTLQKAIGDGNYPEVAAVYNACLSSRPEDEAVLLELMTNDLNKQLSSYAAGNCSAEDLSNAIAGYRKVSAMKELADVAYAKASALEQSKRAYEMGLKETSVLSRLDVWRSVIKDDVSSQASMAENLTANASEYKYTAFVEVDKMSAVAALSNLMLLQSYYPDDADIAEKIRAVQAEALQPPDPGHSSESGTNSGSSLFPNWPIGSNENGEIATPITIQRVACRAPVEWEGEMDLYIDWTNTSGKEIEEIDFEVIPYDRMDKQVSTKVPDANGNYYSRYLARDVGPFENGYVTPEKHVWSAAWNNSSIETVRIVNVYIFYVGETTPVSITDAEDIAALFEQQK